MAVPAGGRADPRAPGAYVNFLPGPREGLVMVESGGPLGGQLDPGLLSPCFLLQYAAAFSPVLPGPTFFTVWNVCLYVSPCVSVFYAASDQCTLEPRFVS